MTNLIKDHKPLIYKIPENMQNLLIIIIIKNNLKLIITF